MRKRKPLYPYGNFFCFNGNVFYTYILIFSFLPNECTCASYVSTWITQSFEIEHNGKSYVRENSCIWKYLKIFWHTFILLKHDIIFVLFHHHWSCEFESSTGEVYSMQHYLIKFISDLRQVDVFFRALRFPPAIKLTATI